MDKLYGLVRDKDGNPKIDDVMNIPKPVLDMLSKKDIEHLEQKHGVKLHGNF